MNLQAPFKTGVVALALVAGALAPTLATAQAQPAPMQGDKWQVGLSIYGYLPTIGGSTSFPTLPGSPSPGVNVDAQTIIDHLKMTFMGSLDLHNGKWGLFNDVLYLDVGGSKSGTRDFSVDGVPTNLTGNLSLDIKGTIWTVAGEYRLAASDPAYTIDLLAGARMFNMKNTLGWSFAGAAGSHPLVGRSGSTVVSETLWDGIVGAKGSYAFGADRQWFVPYYADIGTGQSQLTYQLAAGIGYKYKWGDLIGMWRYLDYNMKSGKPLETMNFNGPMIGATFRW